MHYTLSEKFLCACLRRAAGALRLNAVQGEAQALDTGFLNPKPQRTLTRLFLGPAAQNLLVQKLREQEADSQGLVQFGANEVAGMTQHDLITWYLEFQAERCAPLSAPFSAQALGTAASASRLPTRCRAQGRA